MATKKSDGQKKTEMQERINRATKVDKRHQTDANKWINTGKWVSVRSSNVKAIGYQKIGKQLFVAFKNGSVYRYDGVSVKTAKDMFEAASMGKFVHYRLKKYGYPYTRIQ